uniref:Uncharacterized protein n=1 Tax=Arundo donax TaxID=35708 RepID=A0A0A9A603_ARUDO
MRRGEGAVLQFRGKLEVWGWVMGIRRRRKMATESVLVFWRLQVQEAQRARQA